MLTWVLLLLYLFQRTYGLETLDQKTKNFTWLQLDTAICISCVQNLISFPYMLLFFLPELPRTVLGRFSIIIIE